MHPDHLDTPRVVADATGVTVWRWDNHEPFGLTGPQTDPDGNGQAFVFNLRFAGQYFDAESGLFHNRHRDYDSASGRYVQADPIGLAGGISLYNYVGANPLGFVDPLGLACEAPGAKRADGAVPNVRDNRSKGQKAEDEVASDLEGAGRDVDRQVRKDTPFGPRFIDVEVKDKDGNVLGGVEVKAGNSRYRQDQRSKDKWLRQNGYPVDVVRKP